MELPPPPPPPKKKQNKTKKKQKKLSFMVDGGGNQVKLGGDSPGSKNVANTEATDVATNLDVFLFPVIHGGQITFKVKK